MSTTHTEIAWTDRTWNPVRGCERVSPGCQNCYAESVAYRFSGPGKPFEGLARKVNGHPQWTGVVRTIEDALLEPLSWRKPARIFVNSMSDLFHEDVPDAFIDRVFAVMALCPQHTFQVLTKRPERMRDYMLRLSEFMVDFDHLLESPIADATREMSRRAGHALPNNAPLMWADNWEEWRRDPKGISRTVGFPPFNIWLGVSCETQQYADERIPLLLQTPAAVRWVSAEPLLGPIDFSAYLPVETIGGVELEHWLDWIVFGGESGTGARPTDLVWIRSGVRQCQAAGVAVFVKQLGAVPLVPACRQTHWDYRFVKRPEGERFKAYGVDRDRWLMNLADRKGGDIGEFPEWLRVREYPRVGASQEPSCP